VVPTQTDFFIHKPYPPDHFASFVSVSICPPNGGGHPDRASDSALDQNIPVTVGENRLNVPLRVLPESYWYDRPFVPLDFDQLSFGFDWPKRNGIIQYPGDYCYNNVALGCSRRGVFVTLTALPPGSRPYFLDASKLPESNWSTLPGTQHGADVVRISPNGAIFKATGTNGQVVGGVCDLPPAGSDERVSSSVAMWRRLAQGHCRFYEFPHDNKLSVLVQFPGDLLPQWKRILLITRQKISALKRASNQSPE
jgi:hypothetical protein